MQLAGALAQGMVDARRIVSSSGVPTRNVCRFCGRALQECTVNNSLLYQKPCSRRGAVGKHESGKVKKVGDLSCGKQESTKTAKINSLLKLMNNKVGPLRDSGAKSIP